MSRVILIENAGVKLDFIGSYSASTSNAATHTFTGVNLGPSGSGITVLGVGTVGATCAILDTSVGASSATGVVIVTASGSQRSAALYQYVGGGTGDVTIGTTSANRWHLGVWKLRGLRSTTKSDSKSQSGAIQATLSLSLDVPKLGAAVGFLVSDNLTSNPSWTGLTRDFVDTSSFSNRATGASAKFATAQTGLAISATTPSGGFAFVAASWR